MFDGSSWIWVSGSNTHGYPGVFGDLRVPNPENMPSTRNGGNLFADSQNRLWLWGGTGPDISGFEQGSMNDLWMYSNDVWTWMSGSNQCWQVGIYGTKGIAEPANAPGTRSDASGWVDDSDHLWLFGGDGFDSVDLSKLLNDLWMY